MKVTVLKKPKLIGIIKSSGIQNQVEWIDLEEKRCRLVSSYEAPIEDFEFIDSRDYDALRGEYAGRAMQAMLSDMGSNPQMQDSLRTRASYEKGKRVADVLAEDAVDYADALINELKRPKDFKEMFGHLGDRR